MSDPFPPPKSFSRASGSDEPVRLPRHGSLSRRAESGDRVRLIYGAAQRARLGQRLLVLLEPRARVRRILRLVGASKGVPVLDRSDAAFGGRVEAPA